MTDAKKEVEPDHSMVAGPPERCKKCGDLMCPRCGAHRQHGYGLMGGGMGAYVFCTSDDCGYFEKTPEETRDPEPAEKS